MYGMKGGISLTELKKLKRSDFLWLVKRYRKQIKTENDMIEKQKSSYKARPTGRKKYLGRL